MVKQYMERKSFWCLKSGSCSRKGGQNLSAYYTSEKIMGQLNLIRFPYKIDKAYHFESGKSVKFRVDNTAAKVSLQLSGLDSAAIDNVVVLKVSSR
jgi:hypothetical protein